MTYYKQARIDPDHPLAFMAFQRERGRPIIYKHQLVLFDRIGLGDHPCHWCGRMVRWGRKPCLIQVLVVDHVDGDRLNNEPANLVPACNGCNTMRGRTQWRPALKPTDVFRVASNGQKRRAVEVACDVCGKDFLAPLSELKNGKGRSCSRSCARTKTRRVRQS